MKKLLLFFVGLSLAGATYGQVKYHKKSQGREISTGTGDPVHVGAFGDEYTNTVNGQHWEYKTEWTRAPSGSTWLDIQADAGINSTGIDTGFAITGLVDSFQGLHTFK